MLEVITMQQIFYTSVSPEEYQRLLENTPPTQPLSGKHQRKVL
jgi:hypothetical protein